MEDILTQFVNYAAQKATENKVDDPLFRKYLIQEHGINLSELDMIIITAMIDHSPCYHKPSGHIVELGQKGKIHGNLADMSKGIPCIIVYCLDSCPEDDMVNVIALSDFKRQDYWDIVFDNDTPYAMPHIND